MLLLVPTPIGNLKDITLRGLEALARAQVVLCEDTRVAKRLYALLHERFGHVLGALDSGVVDSALDSGASGALAAGVGSMVGFALESSPANTSLTESGVDFGADSSGFGADFSDFTNDLANDFASSFHSVGALKDSSDSSDFSGSSLDPATKHFISLHSHNQAKFFSTITPQFFARDIVYISDAGMPCICDPGAELVGYCARHGIAYDVLPGACALVSAFAHSGVSSQGFVFGGFLAHKQQEKREQILALLESSTDMGRSQGADSSTAMLPIIFYESPHRLLDSLELLAELAPRFSLLAIKELTKAYQYHTRGTPKQVLDTLSQRNIQGEWVLVLSAPNLSNLSGVSSIPLSQNLDFASLSNISSPASSGMMAPRSLKLYEQDIYDLPLPPKIKAKLLSKLTGKDTKQIYQQLIAPESKVDSAPESSENACLDSRAKSPQTPAQNGRQTPKPTSKQNRKHKGAR